MLWHCWSPKVLELKRPLEHTATAFGLTVSYSKTKFLVAGHGVTQEDMFTIMTSGGSVECIFVFLYIFIRWTQVDS